jgi:coproporphyrinogen III oxidase
VVRVIGLSQSFAETAARWIAEVHDEITLFFEGADGRGKFAEDRWERPGGGGGVTRVLANGEVFEKIGVNRSAVSGPLEPAMAMRLALGAETPANARFFATGVSTVAHPESPMIPTVHLNVRYFEITSADGEPLDSWFGGGTDLTPTFPFPDDATHFHQILRRNCDGHHPDFYPRFKLWCDEYFRNLHRAGEARGIGGVFFDHLKEGEGGLLLESLHRFVDSIGRILPAAYGPIVERRRLLPWGEKERAFQLFRRGRYAEFNLLHDRGTSFGLQSGARAESVLMSLPPLASWDYSPSFAPGSPEALLMEMLRPQEWA